MTARVNVRLRDRDRGFQRMLRNARDVQTIRLRAGVLPEDAGRRYPQNGATVGDVAAWNELGTSRMRARPFLSTWYERRYQAVIGEVVGIVRRNLRDGQARRALRAVAARVQTEIRVSLLSFEIYDTGLLERSLSAAVEVGRRLFGSVLPGRRP